MTDCGIEAMAPPLRIGQGCAEAALAVHDPRRLAAAHERLGLRLPPELAHAAEKRRAEYIAGRCCAAAALAELGLSDEVQVGRATDGTPLWPERTVGSITHTDGFAWAVAARKADVAAVGIDSERVMSAETRLEVESEILVANEIALFAINAISRTSSRETYVTLIFSAKESLLKCLYPLCAVLLAPKDIEVTQVDPNACTLGMSVAGDALPSFLPKAYTARFAVALPYVHTAVRTGNRR